MYVIPVCRSRIARNALFTSRVKIEDERPYADPVRDLDRLVEALDRDQAVVGPKISSWAIRICGSTSAKIVGR